MQQNIYNIGLVKQLAHILKSADIFQMCPTESSVPFSTRILIRMICNPIQNTERNSNTENQPNRYRTTVLIKRKMFETTEEDDTCGSKLYMFRVISI